jgi:hypothetical protein
MDIKRLPSKTVHTISIKDPDILDDLRRLVDNCSGRYNVNLTKSACASINNLTFMEISEWPCSK